jgi:hypothetical protein
MPDNKDKEIKIDGLPSYYNLPVKPYKGLENSANQDLVSSPIQNQFGNTDFGDSKYDEVGKTQSEDISSGKYEYIRGEKQSGLTQLGLGVLRATEKAGIEFAKTPAYLYSLGEWSLDNISKDGEGITLNEALDNVWLNSLESFDENIKTELPVYKSYKAGTGGILDNISSTSFWSSDGADGVGYLLGMMGPGIALKSLNMASKISKLGLGAETANNIELGSQTLLNTSIESLAEAKGVGDRLKSEGASPEEIARASKETFYSNMALLILPNAVMNKNLLGRYNADKSMLDEFKDASGKLMENPVIKKNTLRDYSKSILGSSVSEGLIEEGGQTSIENYEVNKSLGKTELGFIEGVANEYLNTLNTTDGLKSIVLGSVLGSIGGVSGEYKERQAKQEYRTKNFNIISQLIKDNFEGFSVDNEIYDRDDNDVQTNINPTKLRESTEDFINEITESKIRDLSALDDNEILYNYLDNKIFTRSAIPFFKLGDVGLEILNDKIDKSSEVSEKINNTDKSEENKFITEKKQKAKQLLDLYNDTMSIVSEFESVKSLEGIKGYEEYLDKMFNAAFQEVSKQVFYKEQIQDLNNKLSKYNSVIFNDIPQNQIQITKYQKQIDGLYKLLDESKDKYNSLKDTDKQIEALTSFVNNKKSIEKDIQDRLKANEPETITKEQIAESEISDEVNTDLVAALDTNTLDEFNTINNSLKDNPYLNKEQKESLKLKNKELNDLINLFADNIKSGNTSFKDDSEQQFFINNQKHIEDRIKELKSIEDSKNKLPKLSELLGTIYNVEADNLQDIISENNQLITNSEITNNNIENKTLNLKNNVLMTHLFSHVIEDGIFKFVRNEEGYPKLDNNSNLNINTLNRLNKGDVLQLKFVEVSKEINDLYTNLKDFDGKHIGIYRNNQLIGFVQQPHLIDNNSKNPELSKRIREGLIFYRKAVINKLDNNEIVEEKVLNKGTGNLYTKLTKDGRVDLQFNPLINVRDKDKLENQLIFVYSNVEGKLTLPIIDISEASINALNERLSVLNNYTSKSGKVFQLVKDLNNEWSPIPVYPNNIEDITVDKISKIILSLTNDTPLNEIVSLLQPYIYASQSKRGAALTVKFEDGKLKFWANGNNITLDDFESKTNKRNIFLNGLKSLKQNINITGQNNINNVDVQKQLVERNTLLTNTTTFEGEYFVQPYVEYTQNNYVPLGVAVITEKEKLDLTSIQPENESVNSLDEKVKNKLNSLDLDTPLNQNDALSQSFDKTLLDRTKFNKWLNNKLPQLKLSDVKSIYQLQDTLIDAFGLFRDSTIYLFEGAGMKTAYHESFHGVFRNLLTIKQREDLINESVSKYPEPTEEYLNNLQKDLKNTYSKEQLTYLYYEEQLADDFAKYAYDRNDNTFWTKLGNKIKDLFNKIFNLYRIFKSNDTTTINNLFSNINKGKLATLNSKSNSVTNKSLYNEYAYSKKLDSKFGVSNKTRIVNTIGNRFLALHQQNTFNNLKTDSYSILKNIQKHYKEQLISGKLDANSEKEAGLIIVNFPDLWDEVKKFLSYRNVNSGLVLGYNKIKEEIEIQTEGILEYETNLNQDVIEDNEIYSLESKTVKGLGEWTSISGLNSTSNRLKLFLSSIPIVKDGKQVHDNLNIPLYHDFTSLYYYIERNLVDKYELSEQLDTLKELIPYNNALEQVIDTLNNKSSLITDEQFELIRNDFKTNFSKQQLAYSLVKFNTDSSTGKVTYEIIDSNRATISREIYNQFEQNVYDESKDNIGKYDSEGNKIINTDKAKKLYNDWENIIKSNKPLDKKVLIPLLSKIGIEYSPSVLDNIIKNNSNIWKNNVTTLLKYYSSGLSLNLEQSGRKSLSYISNEEVNFLTDKYTSSFINGEGKNIYTVQLPSFISKTVNKFKNKAKFLDYKKEMLEDGFYKYSNLLSELENIDYRNNFKVTYLDSFKDFRGSGEGSTFTNMTPKDFMAMQISLFQNKADSQKTIKRATNKYIYLTPSDKTMCVIIDASKYTVGITEKGTDIHVGKSDIFNKFYNVFLSEAIRINKANSIKNDILTNKGEGKYNLNQLLEHYHVSKKNYGKLKDLINKDELTDNDWYTISNMFDGNAYRFNNFSIGFNNKMLDEFSEILKTEMSIEELEKQFENKRISIITALYNDINKDFKDTLNELEDKGLIYKDNNTGLYVNKLLQLDNIIETVDGVETIITNTPELEHRQIVSLIANFSANTYLHNIEFSNIFNGDFAQYKPNDLQKRTYQSQAMTVFGNFTNKIIKTIVVKDVEVSSEIYDSLVETLKQQDFNDEDIEKIAGKYKSGINVTDAQVYITPELYKRIHVARGTWNNDMQEAYDIAEGIKTGNIKESLHRLLGGIKPYYFGNRFDNELNIQRFEQVKCAMLPLFKQYVDINPLLKNKLEEMRLVNVDMLAHESSFKAAIGFRNDITNNSEYQILDLNTDNFGVQVDNPDHMDEGNDSMRQLKMLILGSVDKSKEYNNVKGSDIINTIMKMESINYEQSLNELKDKMNIKNNVNFIHFIKDMITKRGATINVQESLNIENGDFEYALDTGTLSTQIENMISSIYTNNAIKQSFNIGGSAIQATSLGLKFRNLEEQQVNLTNDAKLLQQELKWIKPNQENGTIEYAECAMPSWTKQFFNKDGTLININDIPEELRVLIAYRIPTEGLHSMLPIKVVKFLPETMGNFILLPYEVTTQLGADFDFDKIYFFGKEFFKDENNQFIFYKYNEESNIQAIRDRYYQYSQTVSNKDRISFEDFQELTIDEQNTRSGRNNNIVDNYLKLLTSLNNLNLIVSPSGFSVIENFKEKYFSNFNKRNFFSSITQRDFKERNHIGIALKGQAALHVSGHSYGVLTNLDSTDYLEDGSLDLTKSININGKNRTNFSGLYTDNGNLIADELASIMAAILDDIKNPLLEPLGINNYTIDVLATIIRSGVDIETALMFTSQPSIKHLSRLLSGNKNKIKDRNEGWYTVDNLIKSYTQLANENLNNIKDNDNPEYKSFITAMYDSSPDMLDIKSSDMLEYLETYLVEDNNIYKGHIVEGKDKLRFKKANPEELLKYYSYQVRILNQFKNIESIAKELNKVNKFFAVNKEVGPNIEDILSKKEILSDITNLNILKGFNLNNIPSLKSVWKIHEEALSWFEQYFPYSTKEYVDIKKLLLSLQTNKSLYEIPVEERQYINNFIRTYTDYYSNELNTISDNYDNLLIELPNLINSINSPINSESKLNNLTYNQIRNNLFIRQLKVVFDKQNKISTIRLKGNRLDLETKNNIIQSFTALYKNNNTKQLAIDLIKHSFLTTGFFKGINSYSTLISPEITKELGYNNVRKDLVNGFKDKTVIIDNKLRLIDQLIRNNVRNYTKTFDLETFGLTKDKPLPSTISTDKDLVDSSNRNNDMIWKVYTEDGIEFNSPMYISVYDKFSKKPELYKKIDFLKYEKITMLGKNASVLEINPTLDIEKSYLKFNNSKEDSDVKVEDLNKPAFDINEFYNTTTQEELDYIADKEAEDLQKMIDNTKDLPNLENNCE